MNPTGTAGSSLSQNLTVCCMACAARIPQNEVEANGRILVAVRQSERPRAEDAVQDERRWLHELQCLRRLLEALSRKKINRSFNLCR